MTRRRLTEGAWFIGSIAIFIGLWEFAYAIGAVNPLTLPPPHVFLGDIVYQSKYFRTGDASAGPGLWPVLSATAVTVMRVLAGLCLALAGSLIASVLITQFTLMRRLLQPMITLLAPISPIAWLPLSVILFGLGNKPALFMVFIGLFFVLTLSLISEIQNVSETRHSVARTLGASKTQTLFLMVFPSILPGLLRSVRLNLFAAWMMVLIAEGVGVGHGLGQVVMLARNTFNSKLVFLTMVIIGVAGFALDMAFRAVERKIVRWDAVANKGASR